MSKEKERGKPFSGRENCFFQKVVSKIVRTKDHHYRRKSDATELIREGK